MDVRTSAIFPFPTGNTFFGKFGPKCQNFLFKPKFGTQTNSNMQNTMMIFTLFASDWNSPFWTNLVQKIKILSLTWSLLLRLIRICRMQWWYLLFVFKPETPFLGKLDPINQNCQFKPKFGTKTNSNMQNSMVVFTFSAFYRKNPFLLFLRSDKSRDFEVGSCRQHGFLLLLLLLWRVCP